MAKRSRRFAVQGVFRYVRVTPGPPRTRREWFEVRVVQVSATTESLARVAAHRLLRAEARAGEFTYPMRFREAVSYLGISRVLDLDGPEMGEHDLWWEFVDERPAIRERPPTRERTPRPTRAQRRTASRTRRIGRLH